FSLVYKKVFPYSLVVGGIEEGVQLGFSLFWEIRKTARRLLGLCRENKTPRVFGVACRAGEIEHYFFERVLHTLWDFSGLPEEIMYNPEKLSRKVEGVLYHMVRTCKEGCTLSILQEIQAALDGPDSGQALSTVENLLGRITSE
ncbi:uncharacterized protein NEMAJ01_2065, partial [Nematocida major]|uniref:uncharacterized protein n=1 Tax=Nematocida major TaxID=1912982 RepID=UPI0020079113